MTVADETGRGLGPVVSSAHLADGALPALSEVEFAVTMMNHSFQRWMTRCTVAAGGPAMSPLEVLILHLVHHRGRDKTLAEVCVILNVEDTHLANYAIRKLTRAGLLEAGRAGKEKTVRITEAGAALCRRYKAVREALLVEGAGATGHAPAELSHAAALLRALSGRYDQAARAAAAI